MNKTPLTIGQRFGRLVVVGVAARDPSWTDRGSRWHCRCDCGAEVVVRRSSLVKQFSKSCGCYRRESSAAKGAKNTTHGLHKTAEYRIWRGIKDRCLNPKSTCWESYGGRGIKVCERWSNSVENFIEDVGFRPGPLFTIERKNNDGDYEPNNVVWATRSQQQRNRRLSVFITIADERLHLHAWAERAGLKPYVIYKRIKWGWPESRLLEPVRAWVGRRS
jgi:hypothetical protein